MCYETMNHRGEPGAGTLIRTRNNQTIVVCTAPQLNGGWSLHKPDGTFLHFVYKKSDKKRYRKGWRIMGHILVNFGWIYTPCIDHSLQTLPVNI